MVSTTSSQHIRQPLCGLHRLEFLVENISKKHSHLHSLTASGCVNLTCLFPSSLAENCALLELEGKRVSHVEMLV